MTEQLPDGIYFDLPEETYFAQRRISKSDIKRIRVSPADWWAQSWLNPSPYPLSDSQIETRDKARKLGRAYHYARLEPEKFAAQYVRALEKDDFRWQEGFCGSDADIKAALKALDLPQTVKGETILDRARRLDQACHGERPIWHLLLEDFEKANEGKETLPGLIWDQLQIDQARLRAQVTIDELLSNGAAEVSILFTCPDTGLPMSTRLDYLRGDGWAEFKTFSNMADKELGQCLREAIMYHGYYIDIVVQLQALTAARDLPAFGAHDGSPSPEQSQILSELFARQDEPTHALIFQQKGGVPNILSRSLDLWRLPIDAQLIEGSLDEEGRADLYRKRKAPSALHTKALWEIEAAKKAYLQYSQIYYEGEPWLPFDPSGIISDEDFPPYWLEKEIT